MTNRAENRSVTQVWDTPHRQRGIDFLTDCRKIEIIGVRLSQHHEVYSGWYNRNSVLTSLSLMNRFGGLILRHLH